MKKFLIAAAAASLALLALVGCGSKSASSGEAKDYAQIIHDARTDEDNEAMMILTPGEEEGSFEAVDGSVEDMSADDVKAQAENFILPMLGLEASDYEDFAASVSIMNVRSYAVAIVKPAEGKADAVQEALENYVTSQQLAMQNYLADQYEIAKAAVVTTVPSGEIVLVCCADADSVLASIEDALAA